MKQSFISFRKMARWVAVCSAVGAASVLHAAIVAPGNIAAFQSGATVETFDNISGVTPFSITDYNPVDLTGSPALFTKDPAQSAFYNSGGATFNNPTGNPGVPIAAVSPTGAIADEKLSGNSVAGPLGVVTPPFTLFEPGAFMEVIFPSLVSKVGLFVAHGSITVILKDSNNQNLSTGEFTQTGSAGEFIGLTRTAADVGGVTILGTGAFTIDDFTYLVGTGGTTTTPDGGSTFGLLAAGASLLFAKRRFGKEHTSAAA